jgi:hypothetical protein
MCLAPNQSSGLVLNCLKNPKKEISTELFFFFFKEQVFVRENWNLGA